MYIPPFKLTDEILQLVSEVSVQVEILRKLHEMDDFSMKSDEKSSESVSEGVENADSTTFVTYMLRTLQETVRQEVTRALQRRVDKEVKNKIESKVENKREVAKRLKVEGKSVKSVEDTPSNLRLGSSERRVVALLAANAHLTIAELGQRTHLSEAGINKILASLRKKGVLERVGANKNGYWRVL